MRWVVKAAVQNALAVAPKGRELNHLLQRRLTNTLPGDDTHFRLKARKALWHWKALRQHLAPGNARPRLFELGTGWDLIVPLIFYGLGVEDQVTVDVAPMLQLDLVAHSIGQYTAMRPELEAAADRSLRPLGTPLVRSREELSERFGIRYLAPCDVSTGELPAGSVDFISSTSTFQHVPEGQISPILAACRRLLVPGGLISCHIDMQDGFAEFDQTVSSYNFLRFSDRSWSAINSALYFQNRLRARDFLALFEGADLEVVEREIRDPNDRDLATVRALPLAPRFASYSADELAIQQLSLVARKR